MKKQLYLLSFVIITSLSCSPKLAPDQNWGNQRWVLTELKEVPVQLSGSRRDAFVEFFPAEKRFSGNGGCNRISGNYSLEKKNHIKLGEVISTKMSCDDIAFETTFLATFRDIDRYEINGNTLTLKDDNKTLLKFESKSPGR